MLKSLFALFLIGSCCQTCCHAYAISNETRKFLENSSECQIQSDSLLFVVTPIEKDHIIAHDGKLYKKLTFGSEIEEFLTINLRDSKKSAKILRDYHKVILKLQENGELKKAFDDWLKKHAFILGSKKRSFQKFKEHPLLSKHMTIFAPFFDEQKSREKKTRPKHEKRRIAILTSTAGGAEFTVAHAIKTVFKKKGYDVFVLDAKKAQKEFDIFYQFSGMQHEEIYSDVFQKENNKGFAYKLTNLAEAIRPFIPDNSFSVLKKRIASFHPDLIITTRYSFTSDVALAYDLDVPLCYFNCDFRLSPELHPLLDVIDPTFVRFWVPADNKECMVQEKSVDLLGYPLREGFKKIKNPAQLEAIREKLGVKKNEKVVLMVMGLQGVGGVMLNFLKQIKDAQKTFEPLHIAVVCGNNTQMKEEMQNWLQNNHLPSHITVKVHGLLHAHELSDYFNIAQVFVGKAGGASSAELMKMGIFAITFTSYEWEQVNLRCLINCGLGVELLNQNMFIDLLKEQLQKEKGSINVPVINWKKRIFPLVEELLNSN